MASTDRQASNYVALLSALQRAPESFEFFEALRWLECAYSELPRFGQSTKSYEDPVRLCQTPSLGFAPRAIDSFEPASAESVARMNVLFFGLFGPHAPLPLHLTEYALDRQRNAKDPTFIAFANIFHHRMLSLLYRAWADAQPTVQFDRPATDKFSLYVGALVGLSTPGLQERDDLPDQYKRFFAGRLLAQARNADGLRSMVEHFFGVSVRIIEFVTEWMRLPPTAHLRLGGSPEVACMGRTTVMGSAVWGAQQRFRLRLGPLTHAQFSNFLPGGKALRQLVAMVKTYVGEEKAWDVQLVLKKEDVPSTRLGKAGRMGLTTWMGPQHPSQDADHVVLKPVG
jgi:type VI secretion system protein ImpH